MIFRMFLVVALSIVLSSCFEMHQDVIISDNGSTKLKVALSVDAKIIAMSAKDKPDTFCTQTSDKSPPNDIKATLERSTEKGDIVCNITIEGPTEKVFAAFLDDNLFSEESFKKQGNLGFKVSSSGNNKRLDLAISPTPAKPDSDPQVEAMLVGATAGRILSWSVTAPQIIETNGKLSEDGKTVTYSLPLATFVVNHTETFRFHVVYNDKPSGYFGWFFSWFD